MIEIWSLLEESQHESMEWLNLCGKERKGHESSCLTGNPLSCSIYLFIQIIIQDTHSKPYLFWKAFSILTIVVHVHKISSLTHMHTHNTSTHINEHAYAYSLYLFIPIILFPFIFHAPCCILMRVSVEAIKT